VEDVRTAYHLPSQEVRSAALKGGGGADEPTRTRRGGQSHAVTGVYRGLTVERQVIVELSHRDVGEQSGSTSPVGKGVVGRRRLHHLFAGAADPDPPGLQPLATSMPSASSTGEKDAK
jgi:hypothetical protein